MNPHPNSSANSATINLLGVLVVSLAWGLGGPASHYVTRSLTSSEATFGRCGVAFLGLLPFLLLNGRKLWSGLSSRGRSLLAASGITLGIHFYFFVSGVAYASLSTAVMLVAVEPVLILAVGVIAFKEKLTPSSLLATLACILGIMTITLIPHLSQSINNASSTRGLGDLAAVLAILSYAFYYWLNRSFQKEEKTISELIPGSLQRGFSIASVIYSFAAITTGILTWFLSPHEPVPPVFTSWTTWAGVLALGLIPTILGHTLSQIVSRRAHPIWVSLMSPGETLMSLLIGFAFLNQKPSSHELIGGLMILFGVGIALYGESRVPQPSQNP